MQGTGKSQLSIWLAARVSRGELGKGAQPRNVLILSAEDDPGTTIVPRLMAAEADMDRVFIHQIDRSLTFPKDIEQLAWAVETYKATLVVIDPVMAYLDLEVDTYRPADVRRTLKAIHEVGQRHQVTTLPLMHFRKDPTGSVLHMVSSSSAFTEAPRSVLGLGRQPEGEPGQLVLVHLKCNVGPMQKALEVTIEPVTIASEDGPIDTSVVQIGGEVDLSAEDVFQKTRRPGRPDDARRAAQEFLLDELGASPDQRVDQTAAKTKWAQLHKGSQSTLKRAAHDLGWEARVADPKSNRWIWVPPEF
jgi:hypothetical protein